MDILSLLSTRKNPIVLDIGAAVTKCGYAGEAEPTCIPTEFITSSGNKLRWSDLCRAQVPQYVELEWRDAIFNFLYKVFFETLLANPKEYRVIYCESITGSTLLRNMMADVMFKKFEVPAMVVVPAQPLSIFPTQQPSALIIDCGFYDTTVVPIFHRVVLSHAHTTAAIGAKSVFVKMSQVLTTYPSIMKPATPSSSATDSDSPSSASPSSLNEGNWAPYDDEESGEVGTEENPTSPWCRTLESLLRAGAVVLRRGVAPASTGTSFVTWTPPRTAASVEHGSQLATLYRIDRSALWEESPLALFENDDEGNSIASSILDSLLKCHIDMRKFLARKLLFVGGLAGLPGFQARVFQEIEHLLINAPRYTPLQGLKGQFDVMRTSFQPQVLPWVGGSIVASVEAAIKEAEVSREKYLETETIPDWTNLLSPAARLRLFRSSADTESDLLAY